MSLRTNPSRNNSKGAEERKEANQEKRCKVSTCDGFRHNFTGYCSQHGNNLSHYGDPHQTPIRLKDGLSPYYKATLKYIEKHEEELGEALELAEKLIKHPDLIRYYSVAELEQWMPANDYRNKGYPITDQIIQVLYRWMRDIKSPKHFLASIIAPHVFTYQEPKRLLSGKPVHMLITRSLIAQCRILPEWKELSHLNFIKVSKPHYISPRNKANLGLRLTNMFTKSIAQMYKEVPKVIDEVSMEKRDKLEYYKMLEKMYRDGDQRVSKEDLDRLRVKLGI